MQVEVSHPEHDPNATSPSWLAYIVMLLARLLASITKLNTIRRTTKFKPEWRDSWPGLRQSEWHRHQMLAQGAALLLAGKTLDDAGYTNVPMPADYGEPCPRTPYEMKRRFAVIADWLRDPEVHIHRHAACGCGYLIGCIKCRKTFTFARVVDVDRSYADIVREDFTARGAAFDDEDVENGAEWMAAALADTAVGDIVVYLDGAFLRLDTTNFAYDGWFAQHDFDQLPHAQALKQPTALQDTLGDKEYWLERELTEG